jgi:hypothetical protein
VTEAKSLWMNGMTCLNCARGWYDGYDANKKQTRPCAICGHQALDRMTPAQFKAAVKARDERLHRS